MYGRGRELRLIEKVNKQFVNRRYLTANNKLVFSFFRVHQITLGEFLFPPMLFRAMVFVSADSFAGASFCGTRHSRFDVIYVTSNMSDVSQSSRSAKVPKNWLKLYDLGADCVDFLA